MTLGHVTLAHLGPPESPHLALSSDCVLLGDLISITKLLPSSAFLAVHLPRGKGNCGRGGDLQLPGSQTSCKKKKNADWLDLDIRKYAETQCGKCHLSELEIWGRLLGTKSCLKQTLEKMTLGILGNWRRATWFTQWGWKGEMCLKNSHF